MEKSSQKLKNDSTLIQKELECLKEVSEDSFNSQYIDSDYNNEENNNDNNNEDSILLNSMSKIEKPKIDKEKTKPKEKEKIKRNKIHCLLKIFEGDDLIFSQNFYDYILIPNLCFKGIPLPNEFLSQNKNKKEPSVEDLNYFNKMTQYRILCYIEGVEIPKFLKNENKLDWKIQVYSTDTIGFVKDTTKEDKERALINSWEINQVGRSQRAENARIKFVEERKFQVDSYIQETEKGII